MTRISIILLIALCAFSSAYAEAKTPGDYVVSAGTLNVRLAANTAGKVAGKLARGQTIEVFEVDDGWARISNYFDGASEGQPGMIARWVFAAHLVAGGVGQKQGSPVAQVSRPVRVQVDPNSPVYDAIRASDDLAKYQGTFVAVSEELVDVGACELSDFRDIGGWWRSAAHKPEPVYYTYCGGGSNNHRIYVNADTGYVFR
jgi:hypothetical protein